MLYACIRHKYWESSGNNLEFFELEKNYPGVVQKISSLLIADLETWQLDILLKYKFSFCLILKELKIFLRIETVAKLMLYKLKAKRSFNLCNYKIVRIAEFHFNFYPRFQSIKNSYQRINGNILAAFLNF